MLGFLRGERLDFNPPCCMVHDGQTVQITLVGTMHRPYEIHPNDVPWILGDGHVCGGWMYGPFLVDLAPSTFAYVVVYVSTLSRPFVTLLESINGLLYPLMPDLRVCPSDNPETA